MTTNMKNEIEFTDKQDASVIAQRLLCYAEKIREVVEEKETSPVAVKEEEVLR